MYKSKLSNGMKIIFNEEVQENEGLISIAIFIKVGSRCELNGQNGIAHLIEHIYFEEIYKIIQIYACKFNAVTTREYTCYYVICLKNDVEDILRILCKVFESKVINDENIQRNKNIIKQEIFGNSREIEHKIDTRLICGSYGNLGLGNLVYGKIDDISKINIDQVLKFYLYYYSVNNSVISVCGKLEDDFIKEINIILSRVQTYSKAQEFCKDNFSEMKSSIFIPDNNSYFRMALAFENCSYHSNEEALSELCVELLGGSNKSLLFRKFRDEYGLVYNIYMEQIVFYFEGIIYLYLDTCFENVEGLCQVFNKLIKSDIESLFNKADIEKAKKQLKFSMLCDYERNTAIMTEYGLSYLLNRRVRGAMDYIKRIDELDENAVYDYMKKIAKARKNIVYSAPERIF